MSGEEIRLSRIFRVDGRAVIVSNPEVGRSLVVEGDNKKNGYKPTEHLLHLSYREISYNFTGHTKGSTAQGRQIGLSQGWARILQKGVQLFWKNLQNANTR